MRRFISAALVALCACGGTEAPAGSTPAGVVADPTPAATTSELDPTPICTLDLRDGDAWKTRAEIPCPEDGVDLMVVGDVGYANPILDGSVAGMKTVCAELGCDAALIAGDLIYGPGADAVPHWKAIWDDALATVGLPSIAVLGNHEWRHEPEPEKKRAAVKASDGRAGLIAPGPSFAVRLARAGAPVVAFAGLDTDSVSNPIPAMPGLGDAAFDVACAEGVPVVVVGHHPPSSQGQHHDHEAHVEKALRDILAGRRAAGCDVQLVVAGHDHDLQVYPPACEQADVPAVVVSGVAGRGFRPAGPAHLPKCGPGPSEGMATTYVAARGAEGGFAHVRLGLGDDGSEVRLYATPADKPLELITTVALKPSRRSP